MSTDDFRASLGWLQCFMKWKGLSLRRKTTICQIAPADCIPKLVSFVTYMRSLQMQHKYCHDAMFTMDETACWLDMSSGTTIESTGARSVPLKTTWSRKRSLHHHSFSSSSRADGTKLKPYVVFKGKGTRLIMRGSNVLLIYTCSLFLPSYGIFILKQAARTPKKLNLFMF